MEAEEGHEGGVQLNDAGKYVFNQCSFKSNNDGGGGISIYNAEAEVEISNSTFEQLGDYITIDVQSAKTVDIINNIINSNNMIRSDIAIIKIGDYWKRKEASEITSLSIKGNTINSNIAAKGVSTLYSGTGSSPYIIQDNVLTNAELELK
jgi:hypothetical protein